MVLSRTAPVESKFMSHIQNDQWIEAAQENFEESIERGDLPTAKNIIADVFDAGFSNVARAMNLMLRETPISKFAIKSSWPNI